MDKLLQKIKNCRECEKHLHTGINPVLSASKKCKLLIISQAPGLKVHQTSIPWNDKSGDTLRSWLEIDKTIFYDADKIALVPMGFCYPGKGKSGDLPPRNECAPLWHQLLLNSMKEIKLTLLIGQYAQKYYLEDQAKDTLTETVRNFSEYLPTYFPLPHPSPRNNIWLRKNQWFAEEVIPELRKLVKKIIA
jgi:uracil-DNA glycosylase